MKKTFYKEILETTYTITLKNKMKVVLLYKKEFAFKSCYIVCNFGHFDCLNKIKINGKYKKIPWGTAHFLEHRMFSIENQDASDLLSNLGANSNAYTTYEKTVYYFQTQENFYECLKVFLKMISTFTSTPKQIENEKQIILQEKKMYEEDPQSILNSKILKQAYFKHPINKDIIGSNKNIKDIDEITLKAVFDKYYDPSNLTLVVSGNINPNTLEKFLNDNLILNRNILNKKGISVKEPNGVKMEFKEFYLPTISIPRFACLFKLIPEKNKQIKDKDYFCYYFILDYLFASSGKLSEKWLKDKILTNLFDYTVISNIDLDCIIFYNITDNCKTILTKLKEVFNLSYKLSMTENELNELKKIHYGNTLRVYETESSISSSYVYDMFTSCNDFFLEIDEVKQINLNDINNAFKKMCNAIMTVVVLKGE